MRKILTLLLAMLMLVACLSACTQAPVEESSEPESAVEPVETPEPTAEPTEEPTPEPTAAPVATGNKPDFGPLSDDLYSFQIQVNEDVYQFPMTYADFIAYGWVYDDDDTTVLDSNYYSTTEVFEIGDLECYASIVNFDINSRPLNECYIGGISFDQFQIGKAPATVITVPGGLKFGEATSEDFRTKFGTPSYENITDSGAEYVDYEKDSYEKYSLVFDAETKKLKDVEIKNLSKPEDFVDGEVSTEIPEIISKYTSPKALDDDLSKFIIKYSGKLYQLPAPVSEFVADGWKIEEADTQMTVEGRGNGWLTMMKDNQKLRTLTKNYSGAATDINNCFVTSVVADDSSTKVELLLGKGIKTGMSQSDLEAALTGVEFEKEDSSSYIYYEVMPTGSKVDDYEIYVKKETSQVYKIEASYGPSYNDFTGE